MVAETAEETRILIEKSEIESKQGLKVELLENDEIHNLAPYLNNKVQSALLCPDEGHCNPRLLTPAFARRTQANGTQILTDTNVSGIRRADGKWKIDTAGRHQNDMYEPVIADVVLNAAGAWAAEVGMMAGISLPLFPVGLIMNVTEKVPPILKHLIQHAGRKLSMKQVDDGNLLIGGGWLAELQQNNGQWLSHLPSMINTNTIKENLRVAADIVPFIKDLHLIRTWSGITTLAPDQLPLLGEIPRSPGLYVAAGGSAFTYGPTYARLMSELILNGSTSFPITPYAADRFL
jgi:glycine/D-amino acid oxidase-like deaminating enzyme